MSKANPLPPQDVVRNLLNYDAETGAFTWKNPAYAKYKGRVAGKIDPITKYRRIRLGDRGVFMGHRLAWLYVHGDYDHALFCIDHIDGNRSNNAIANLRLATFSQNTAHCKTRRNTKTGVKGVTVTHHGTYRVVIRPHGPGSAKIELGCYGTLEEAAAVRLAASRAHFGPFSKEDDACRAIAS
jgi:hypothetical protein